MQWFQQDEPAHLTYQQARFLAAVDSLLARLDPPGASREESWQSLIPGDPSELYVCIAPAGSRHDSLAISFGGSRFYGGWADRHYAWEGGRGDVVATVDEDDPAGAFDAILEWIESELRRPAVVIPLRRKEVWVVVSDRLPKSWRKRMDQAVPAGFFDPIPPGRKRRRI